MIVGHAAQSRRFGRGFLALGLSLLVLYLTVAAWAQLLFGPQLNEALHSLFSHTTLPPPTIVQRLGNAWQLILALTALGCVVTVLLGSRWMTVAALVWCGSVVVLAVAEGVRGTFHVPAAMTLFASLLTMIGVHLLRRWGGLTSAWSRTGDMISGMKPFITAPVGSGAVR